MNSTSTCAKRSEKRKHGEDYEPPSLRRLFSSVNRFLNEDKYRVSGIADKEFNQARKCMEARRKQL